MSEVWSGFLVGLLSSFHCVGMCGPIALALPSGNTALKIYSNAFLYNVGRIITYSFLGVLVGWFGRLFFYSGISQIVSIGIGIAIIIGFILPQKYFIVFTNQLGIQRFTNFLRTIFSTLFKSSHPLNLLFIGVVNGFLPCGFVYLAAGNALVLTGGVGNSVLYMFLFGLGTFPLMFMLVTFKSFISLKVRGIITKLIPYIAILMGILLILRGLELDIPYLSPFINFSNSGTTEVECH